MSLADRTLRSLFVALAVGLGWGIRGDFGHLLGAMYPGAALALGLAYVSGQRPLFLWMPILGGVSALGIGLGGMMSYGILHGYAQSDTLVNYAYGFVTLFLQGSAWGTFGGALIGLVLERRAMRTGEWLGLVGSILAAGWFTSFVVVDLIGFHINPPRSNLSIAFFGAALGQLAWLALNGKPTGLRGAVLGYVGFGLGMAGGRLLGNIANVMQTQFDFTINHWNVMETSCGFIGGFVVCFGLVNVAFPEPPEKENIRLASFWGMVYVLGVIPLWHVLSRIKPFDKQTEWAAQLKTYGYENPERLAEIVAWLVYGVCGLGFVGVVLWMLIYFRRHERFAALPVLWLSVTMLLLQNLNALYFFYPVRPKLFNMHSVFWAMLGLMVLYAAIARPKPVLEPAATDTAPRFGWLGLLAGAAVAVAFFIFAAGYVNNEETMKSANTRWPIWVWTQGPFPREADAK